MSLFILLLFLMYLLLQNVKQRSSYKSRITFLLVNSITKFFALSLYDPFLHVPCDAYFWIAF